MAPCDSKERIAELEAEVARLREEIGAALEASAYSDAAAVYTILTNALAQPQPGSLADIESRAKAMAGKVETELAWTNYGQLFGAIQPQRPFNASEAKGYAKFIDQQFAQPQAAMTPVAWVPVHPKTGPMKVHGIWEMMLSRICAPPSTQRDVGSDAAAILSRPTDGREQAPGRTRGGVGAGESNSSNRSGQDGLRDRFACFRQG